MHFLLFMALTLSTANLSSRNGDSILQLQKLANEGDSLAQFWLGIAYERGKGVPVNQSEAVKWVLRSANQGNPDAQNWMGRAYEEGAGVTQSFAKAAHWYWLACENRPDYGGAGQGCNNLGLLYFYGNGVSQSFARAYLYARIARNEEQASLCAEHMSHTQRENVDRQYAQWLREHGETAPAQR
jgi:TPR repeat protein